MHEWDWSYHAPRKESAVKSSERHIQKRRDSNMTRKLFTNLGLWPKGFACESISTQGKERAAQRSGSVMYTAHAETPALRDTPPHGEDQPPATSTHSARQLPCLPSTSTMSVSHRQRHPTPFSLTGSGLAQYSSSSIRFFSSSVVRSR